MKLILLPGLDGTGVFFRPLLAVLPKGIEPLVISYPVDRVLGYEQLLPLIAAKLPNDEPYVVLGESFGGPLALHIAAQRAPHLKGLTLAGSFVSCPVPFVPKWTASLVGAFPFRSFRHLPKIRSLLGTYDADEHFELSKEALSQVQPSVFAHRVREIIRVNAEDSLRRMEVPALYLQGTNDWVVTARNLRLIRRIAPKIDCVTIDSSHMILKTQPRASANAIVEFINRL